MTKRPALPVRRVDLLVPHLAGWIPARWAERPETPVLSRLFGRARRAPSAGSDPVTTLMARFGIPARRDRDPPSGALSRLAHCSAAGSHGFIMHADPVHLRPEGDRLVLFAGCQLALTTQETDALVALFNRHFAAEGLRLEAVSAECWYLHLSAVPELTTTPLPAAVGRSIDGILPQGRDAVTWARILNETQMLFHDSDVNRARESAGRPRVNGIWPWGGGRLPDNLPATDYERVYADDSLTLGLAAASKVAAGPLPEDTGLIEAGQNRAILLVWSALQKAALDMDPVDWTARVERLDGWVAALLGSPNGPAHQPLFIYPCNGEVYRLSRWDLARIWRRSLPLRRLAAPGQVS